MKKSPARFLCVILAIALLLTALPITVYAEDNVFEVNDAQGLADACTAINGSNDGNDGNVETYTIELKKDIVGGYIGITNGDAVVTVFGNGHTIDRSNASGTGIYAAEGATVNLGSPDGGEKTP